MLGMLQHLDNGKQNWSNCTVVYFPRSKPSLLWCLLAGFLTNWLQIEEIVDGIDRISMTNGVASDSPLLLASFFLTRADGPVHASPCHFISFLGLTQPTSGTTLGLRGRRPVQSMLCCVV